MKKLLIPVLLAPLLLTACSDLDFKDKCYAFEGRVAGGECIVDGRVVFNEDDFRSVREIDNPRYGDDWDDDEYDD